MPPTVYERTWDQGTITVMYSHIWHFVISPFCVVDTPVLKFFRVYQVYCQLNLPTSLDNFVTSDFAVVHVLIVTQLGQISRESVVESGHRRDGTKCLN